MHPLATQSPWTALLLCAGTALGFLGCQDRRPPTVGIAMGGRATEAGLWAAEAGDRDGRGVHVLARTQGSNRAETAIRLADTMVAMPGLVAVVGHANSAASLAASQIYNRARVVQIAPHSSASLYSRAGPYSFRMVSSDERQGAFLAESLAREYRSARLAVLYVNDDYGRGLRRAFLQALDHDRFPVAFQLPHVEQDVDSALVAGTVEALRRVEPDALVWLGRGTILQRHLGALRERLGPLAIWGSDATVQRQPGAAEPGEWAEVRYVDFAYPENSPDAVAFREESRRRFGRDPETAEILTYDAVGVVMAGIRSGADSGPELRDFLMSLGRERPPYQGVSGPVTFELDGDGVRDYVLRKIPSEKGSS